ncbi:uncharacterized protein LOC120293192 [Eucalyptus grandis]|uniref:uncharacterized protein LOC120293192 n=1 Tax=Eucalyptus grandis TaxID=71139 RepID=UPI00192ECD39|nr:uncharacterized protein LOC120293192 [Eucalyptus grandis]
MNFVKAALAGMLLALLIMYLTFGPIGSILLLILIGIIGVRYRDPDDELPQAGVDVEEPIAELSVPRVRHRQRSGSMPWPKPCAKPWPSPPTSATLEGDETPRLMLDGLLNILLDLLCLQERREESRILSNSSTWSSS